MKEVEADDYDEGAKLDLAFAYAESGQKDAAARIVDEVLAKKDVYYSPCSVGIVMLSLGRNDEGMSWMERACKERDGSLLYFRSFPAYEKYRASPRWVEVEKRMAIKGGSG